MIKTFWLAIRAVPVTLRITVVSLALALPLGFAMALARIYRVRILGELSALYISFIRGTPMVLQILIVYSLLPSLLNAAVKSRGWAVNVFDLNPIIYAYAVFSLNNAAALAELIRSGLSAVDKGQHEAALATGLSPLQSFTRIIIPQALVSALPNLCNLTITLIKNTSLAFIMTVKDITAAAKIEASYGYNYVEAYVDIFIIYIILCTLVQWAFHKTEAYFGAYKRPPRRGKLPDLFSRL
ncbi:MAG: amino acid ABC transporter permease [Treponema sp.]|jgi:L-cystine transport system permease protein|nr:amino acid ABC transporter permease [Treponema sp.]